MDRRNEEKAHKVVGGGGEGSSIAENGHDEKVAEKQNNTNERVVCRSQE